MDTTASVTQLSAALSQQTAGVSAIRSELQNQKALVGAIEKVLEQTQTPADPGDVSLGSPRGRVLDILA